MKETEVYPIKYVVHEHPNGNTYMTIDFVSGPDDFHLFRMIVHGVVGEVPAHRNKLGHIVEDIDKESNPEGRRILDL